MAQRSTLPLLAVVAAAAVACSSGSSRGSFDDTPVEPAATSDQTEAATPPATTSTPPAPVDAKGDASAPDAGDSCKRTAPSNTCGLVPQCGCATGETCDVQDTAGNVACVTAGKAAMGRPCTTTSGCAQGLTCVGGTCHAFCDAVGTACTTSGTNQCIQAQNQGSPIPNLKVCMVTCDLRDPNACGGTTAAGTAACAVDDKGNTDCQTAGTAALNATCGPTVDCAPSLVCVDLTQNGTTTSKCKKWCRVGTNDCGGAVTCSGFQTKVLVGGTEYGVCP